ncbi:MAG: mRNA surveillance protein pelota [Sulfolobales archaeon]|nr:mRNA surveillance protein pelota [Sulfolobales archaeon]MDW8083180.1 mRNA surveillance protein pelota [Sulfolobales archaeon]
MKIVREDLKHGLIEVRVECEDDLWILKNIITKDDVVAAKTLRDVKIDGEGKRRLPMVLAVRVEDISFQPFSGRLRVHGKVVEGPEKYGVKGSYHTLNIDVGTELAIVKSKWTQEQISRLKKASSRRVKVLLAAFDFDELAVAALLEQGVRYVVERNLPGIRDEGPPVEELVREVSEAVIAAVEREKPDIVIVASPAFLKDYVADTLRRKLGVSVYVDSVSSGGRAGVSELMRRDSFKNIFKTHSVILVESIFEEFMKLLTLDSEKVAYGLDVVKALADFGAISKLLVNEDMLYGEYCGLVSEIMEKVESRKGEVRIVPEETSTFSKVKAFGGLIAILKYSVDTYKIAKQSENTSLR